IPNLWSVVEALSVNYLSVVPTILNQLVQMPVNREMIRSLRAVTSGSAPLSHAIAQRFEQLTGLAVREGYGLTETTSAVMMNPARGVTKVGSSGLLYPYHRAWLRPLDVAPGDEPGRADGCLAKAVELPLGSADWVGMSDQAGELVLSGPQVAETPLYTGDLARIDEDGYLWIVGRLKDVSIRGAIISTLRWLRMCFISTPRCWMLWWWGSPMLMPGKSRWFMSNLKRAYRWMLRS